MATVLQVTASTAQAVGAFNALAQSIMAAQNRFAGLNTTMGAGAQGATRYAGSVTAINTAFQSMVSLVSAVTGIIARLGAGVEFAFSSIVKELDKLQGFNAIMSVTTKSSEAVANAYDFLRKTADRLGVQFDALTGNYAKLTAALPEGSKGMAIAERVFLGVANAARTLHSSNSDVQLMFYAITQMASKGVISMEELRRQLGEKLPGVIQIAAKALNTVPEELEKAIRKGAVISEKFLPIFGDALIRTFAESAEKASTSVSASINRLTNVWVDFVKHILDSGAGTAIAGIFDAIREKLSDPYVIDRFASMIKYLSEQVTSFIRRLTQDDIRNGFDSFVHAVEAGVTVVGKLISLLQWVINNGGKAGAIMGALFGGAVGAMAGPVGLAVGAAAGAAGGAYLGSSLGPSAGTVANRDAANAAALAKQQAARAEQDRVLRQELIPTLKKFEGWDSMKGIDNLFKAQNLNTQTVQSVAKILTDPAYKTGADRTKALQEFAKLGVALSPANATLADVLGTPTPKKPRNGGRTGSSADPLDAAELRAKGLNSNYLTELGHYHTLLKTGRLDQEQYVSAVEDLIKRQPFAAAMFKESAAELRSLSQATTDHITFVMGQIQAREKLESSLQQELDYAGMRSKALELEHSLQQRLGALREAGVDLTSAEIAKLRERLQLIQQTSALTRAEDSLIAGTVGKREEFRTSTEAMRNLASKPVDGIQQGDSATMLMQIAPDVLQNTQVQLDAQVALFQDMYDRIRILREADLISETTASQARAQVAVQESQARLKNTSDFFSNLSALSSSGNKRIAAIGKAAAVAQATIDGILAVQKALAAPPGWPANAPNVIAVGAVQAANVAKIAGFQEGGYTGNYGTSQIAGVVHGQEFVTNAAATRRNRAVLEAMNDGATFGGSNTRVSVVVNNNASGTTASVREREGPTGPELEVLVESVTARSIRRGGAVSSALESQYGLNRSAGLSR